MLIFVPERAMPTSGTRSRADERECVRVPLLVCVTPDVASLAYDSINWTPNEPDLRDTLEAGSAYRREACGTALLLGSVDRDHGPRGPEIRRSTAHAAG